MRFPPVQMEAEEKELFPKASNKYNDIDPNDVV
jgi:hypothetical protein